MNSKYFSYLAIVVGLLLLWNCQAPQQEPAITGKKNAAGDGKEVRVNPLKDAFFGELHLHASYSLDAYGFGNKANSPDEAYRFAKGEEVILPGGGTTRITAPYFHTTGDGFLVWGSFPAWYSLRVRWTPKGFLARVIAPFSRTADIWVHSFGLIRKVGSSTRPHPRTGSISATRLVVLT